MSLAATDSQSEQTLKLLRHKRDTVIADRQIIEQISAIDGREKLDDYVDCIAESMQSSTFRKGKKSKRFDEICNSIDSFLESHKSLGDIARAAHPQIGGLIFGILSFLVKVR